MSYVVSVGVSSCWQYGDDTLDHHTLQYIGDISSSPRDQLLDYRPQGHHLLDHQLMERNGGLGERE